jgi:hypothetical protein
LLRILAKAILIVIHGNTACLGNASTILMSIRLMAMQERYAGVTPNACVSSFSALSERTAPPVHMREKKRSADTNFSSFEEELDWLSGSQYPCFVHVGKTPMWKAC